MDVNQNIRGIGWPFFLSTGQQNYLKRHCYKDLASFRLICTQYKLLPFQLLRPSSDVALSVFYLENINTGETYNLLASITPDLEYQKTADVSWVIYSPQTFFTSLIPCGQYIAHASDGSLVWESEVITIETFVDIIDAGVFTGIDAFGNGLLISDDDFLKYDINSFITS